MLLDEVHYYAKCKMYVQDLSSWIVSFIYDESIMKFFLSL